MQTTFAELLLPSPGRSTRPPAAGSISASAPATSQRWVQYGIGWRKPSPTWSSTPRRLAPAGERAASVDQRVRHPPPRSTSWSRPRGHAHDGSKMLALAGERTGDHLDDRPKTIASRDKAIAAGVPVWITDDVESARAIAAEALKIYGQLPSYQAMLDEGVAGPEDMLAGDPDTVRAGLEYAAAGVDEIAMNVLGPRSRSMRRSTSPPTWEPGLMPGGPTANDPPAARWQRDAALPALPPSCDFNRSEPADLDVAVFGVPFDGTSNRRCPLIPQDPGGIGDDRPYNMATRAAPFDSLRIDDLDIAAMRSTRTIRSPGSRPTSMPDGTRSRHRCDGGDHDRSPDPATPSGFTRSAWCTLTPTPTSTTTCSARRSPRHTVPPGGRRRPPRR